MDSLKVTQADDTQPGYSWVKHLGSAALTIDVGPQSNSLFWHQTLPITSEVTLSGPEMSIVLLVGIGYQFITGLSPTVIRFQRPVSTFQSSYLTQRLGVINQKKSHRDPVINYWHVLFYIGLSFNGHLGDTDTKIWSRLFSAPFIWLSIRRTSLVDGHYVLAPKVSSLEQTFGATEINSPWVKYKFL